MPRSTPADDDRPGLFRVRDALSNGVPPHRLRSPSLHAPFHGVRTSDAADDLTKRCRALLPLLDDGTAFSRATALRLLGVELPWVLEDELEDDRPIHVVTTREEDRVRRQGIVAHRSRQTFLEVTEVDGLPVTSPAQTFVLVGADLRRPDDVVVLGDAMMRRQKPLASPSELLALAERTHKVKGIVQVREQISRMRPGTDSSMETRTRLVLVGAGLPCPAINEVVTAPDGRYVKRVDMLYPELRIAIEYDGDQHRVDQAQWREDVRARRLLESLGWIVIVVVADDVIGDPSELIATVRAARRARARSPV